MFLSATHIPTGETTTLQLTEGKHTLGRATASDPPEKLAVSFDPKLSRRCARLEFHENGLFVERDESRYPLYHEGVEKDSFHLHPGQRFSSGETVFELLEQVPLTLTVQVIEEANRENAEQVLSVLLHFQELFRTPLPTRKLVERTASLLESLLPEAEVVFFELVNGSDPVPLGAGTIRPSRTLLSRCSEERLPVFHLWEGSSGPQPTRLSGERWALAAPVFVIDRQLVLYAVGSQGAATPGGYQRSALALVAQLLVQHLESRQALLLQARVEAQEEANRKLRILLETVEETIGLQTGEQGMGILLKGACALTGARRAFFEAHPGENLRASESVLSVNFDGGRGGAIVCYGPGPFDSEALDWLSALARFAQTVLDNRELHDQVQSTLAQLRESQEQLVRSRQWAAAGRLAANAAHELNTPLGAIKLAAETAPDQDGMQLILRAVARCQRVTERFLYYSREEGPLRCENISLAAVVEDSLESLTSVFESQKIAISTDVPAKLVAVGDPQSLFWALTSVLRNAAEALGHSCNRERSVRIVGGTEGTTVWLTVADTGPGVRAGTEEEIFEPFFSTRKIGEASGLGLALSRRNLRTQGGDLVLMKGPGSGACFRLSLPGPK